MDLANYKKVWKDQPEERNKISSLDIYKMTQSRSTSIVKWIFMIGLVEFIFWFSIMLPSNFALRHFAPFGYV